MVMTIDNMSASTFVQSGLLCMLPPETVGLSERNRPLVSEMGSVDLTKHKQGTIRRYLSCLRVQIEKCKLGMREAVKECEESGGDRAIPAEHIDEDGEIDEKYIHCGRCHDPESYEVRFPIPARLLSLFSFSLAVSWMPILELCFAC
jgi:hypothetical protein